MEIKIIIIIKKNKQTLKNKILHVKKTKADNRTRDHLIRKKLSGL
jgi:hypothetical protein